MFIPKFRANLRQSSATSSDTRVLRSASALPVCESNPLDREKATLDEWASSAVSSMLSSIKEVCITEHLWMVDELSAWACTAKGAQAECGPGFHGASSFEPGVSRPLYPGQVGGLPQ